MSDFGIFESDEAAQAEPRLAARTAARKLEAAVDEVRAKFGRFLMGATGIDEFEDRWHLSKADIRAAVEPLVFPNTGTMRRIQNAMKADWKLAHPYKVANDGPPALQMEAPPGYQSAAEMEAAMPVPAGTPSFGDIARSHGLTPLSSRRQALSHDEAGFGSMPTDDTERNLDTDITYQPSSGNLIPKGDFKGYERSVAQGGPEKVQRDFTPGGDSGTNRAARRHVARDPRHYDMVGHEYDNINDPAGSPEIMEDDGDYEGVHNYYKNLMEEPPAGYPRRPRSLTEDEKPIDPRNRPDSGFGDLGSFVEDTDPILARRVQAGGAGSWYDQAEQAEDYNYKRDTADKSDDDNKKEAAMLVADIYTDFAQANGLRVASLDTLDHYASTGIAEADYRLLESMIVRAAAEEEESEEEPEEADEDDHEEPDADNEGGPSDGDEDNEDDDDEESDSDDDGDEDYDFSGGDEGGEGAGGEQFTVPEHAPDLDPQMLNEIPHDDPQGAAPVPPEVVDSLLGLPEGTIEQLLLEEVEQGQGGDPGMSGPPMPPEGGAPQGGGDDFFGQGGDDEQVPPRQLARRRQASSIADLARHYKMQPHELQAYADMNHHDQNAPLHPEDEEFLHDLLSKSNNGVYEGRRRQAAPVDYSDEDDNEPAFRPGHEPDYERFSHDWNRYQQREKVNREWQDAVRGKERDKWGDIIEGSRQFWAAPDEAEGDLMARQQRQHQDALDTKFGPAPTAKPNIRDLTMRAQNGDGEAYAALKGLWKDRGWTAARRFWAADDDQSGGDSGGGDDQGGAPQGDPTGGMGADPSAMMGGGMMPPPGSASVAPPQPPMPLENQPAEDALLDTANQAIMQMIDRETQEYQQIIGPLSQALQAVQFAQQVEQSEHPMDVTPPQGTVNVDPSQAPGGAQNPQQQLARLVREAKTVRTLKNAAKLIGQTYGVNSGMLIEAMGRRQYEHVAEAFHILPPQALEDPYVRAAANHIGKMFAAENPMFNTDAWMSSAVGPRTALGSRLPFDQPRLAGENQKNTPTLDAFEWDNTQPKISDNMTINDLPKQQFKGLPKMKAYREADIGSKVQNWMKRQTQNGLNMGGDAMVHRYIDEHKQPASQRGINEVHEALGITPEQPANNPAPKEVKVPKAVNPVTKKGTWGEWEPTKEASFFTRRVPGWKWDDHLSGYISKEGKAFTCSCGEKIPAPSYRNCKCGKLWNLYAIGDTHHLASDTADMFIAREIPIRPGVVMANRKLAKGDCECWDGYERVPGTKPCAEGSCRKCDSHRKESRNHSHAELVAMIDKLADWTKYDDDIDPAVEAYGKTKVPSTKVSQPPKDWAKRKPAGDPGKQGGTWTPPTIPRKKK